ncbi:Putative TrapT family, dctQ subunit, C4-dicarboxylate transport [Neorhizobium galegae bv. officinalis bv. officinalis str. HAMBI 1141]|uniref:TRAP transporter small permease protein n=1 Tax=Neorhizobium galegae bv. officinalis bv. officinalis str. HAMBI 1141 TaxID=1028801 RepID=A0A068T7L3_NEOGA|nr:TRAP transporter small permease [Neorhizobium galegae]CDN54517.1 Putative TrapT family, dctQ subunit, C4-dicarboxylate transport [Neorhizobium galegae bv. officinalis bv. officinalis str. HAMBI 1141]
MTRYLERFTEAVDMIAGLLLGLCTILIVVSTIGRYIFSWAVPDSFDLSRYLIGACMMWGFASIGYRGGHIAVDLLYEPLGSKGRRVLDFIAWSTLLAFTAMLAYMMFFRLTSAYNSNETTFDLRIPVWPLIGLIWLGCASAVITTAVVPFLRRKAEEPNPLEGHGV